MSRKTPQKQAIRTKKSLWKKLLEMLPWAMMFKLIMVGLFLLIAYSPPAQHSIDRWKIQLDHTFTQMGLSYETYTITGRKYTPQADILNAIESTQYHSLPFYDLATALDNLSSLPWVLKASLSKEYPNKLHIKLLEKTPVARFQSNGKLYVLDQFGDVINTADAAKFQNLILFVGAQSRQQSPEMLKELNRYPGLKRITSALTLVNERRWDMHLRNKIIVKMPEGHFVHGLKKLHALNDIGSLLDRKVSVIDLRIKNKVILESPNHSKFEY